MTKTELIRTAENYIEHSKDNYISEETALTKKVAGLKLFDAPILAFGDAKDDCFKELKQPSAIGEHYLLPKDWLLSAQTVITFFLPFTEEVRKGNQRNMTWPSDEWLHARIEGQMLVNKLCMHLKSLLIDAGYQALVPTLDERFWSNTDSTAHPVSFTSNWSERHAAYICGLGTFGLSKGLITKKGMAGRFGSILTNLYLEPDMREYHELYEYCSMCGRCVKNCPVNAITKAGGKNNSLCSEFLDETKVKHDPRYACGKCQVHVPCEAMIPKHN